jgi:hypothetical protein
VQDDTNKQQLWLNASDTPALSDDVSLGKRKQKTSCCDAIR